MSDSAAESAAWKLHGIGQDFTAQTRAIALEVKRGDVVSLRITACRKMIAQADKALTAFELEWDRSQEGQHAPHD